MRGKVAKALRRQAHLDAPEGEVNVKHIGVKQIMANSLARPTIGCVVADCTRRRYLKLKRKYKEAQRYGKLN